MQYRQLPINDRGGGCNNFRSSFGLHACIHNLFTFGKNMICIFVVDVKSVSNGNKIVRSVC